MFGQNNGIHQVVSVIAFCIAIWGVICASGAVWVAAIILVPLSLFWFLFIGHGFIYPGLLLYAILDCFSRNSDDQ